MFQGSSASHASFQRLLKENMPLLQLERKTNSLPDSPFEVLTKTKKNRTFREEGDKDNPFQNKLQKTENWQFLLSIFFAVTISHLKTSFFEATGLVQGVLPDLDCILMQDIPRFLSFTVQWFLHAFKKKKSVSVSCPDVPVLSMKAVFCTASLLPSPVSVSPLCLSPQRKSKTKHGANMWTSSLSVVFTFNTMSSSETTFLTTYMQITMEPEGRLRIHQGGVSWWMNLHFYWRISLFLHIKLLVLLDLEEIFTFGEMRVATHSDEAYASHDASSLKPEIFVLQAADLWNLKSQKNPLCHLSLTYINFIQPKAVFFCWRKSTLHRVQKQVHAGEKDDLFNAEPCMFVASEFLVVHVCVVSQTRPPQLTKNTKSIQQKLAMQKKNKQTKEW